MTSASDYFSTEEGKVGNVKVHRGPTMAKTNMAHAAIFCHGQYHQRAENVKSRAKNIFSSGQ